MDAKCSSLWCSSLVTSMVHVLQLLRSRGPNAHPKLMSRELRLRFRFAKFNSSLGLMGRLTVRTLKADKVIKIPTWHACFSWRAQQGLQRRGKNSKMHDVMVGWTCRTMASCWRRSCTRTLTGRTIEPHHLRLYEILSDSSPPLTAL